MKPTAYLLLAVILFFSACAEPSPLVFKGVQSIKIEKASFGKNSFKAEFAYQNPNRFGLVLNKLDCNVFINDQLFTQYKLVYKQKQLCFDKEAAFTKMSFKNRMVILSAQGPLNLTIPILGGREQKTAIKDILIAYDAPWQAQHFKAIKTCCKRAPYFEYYEADLEKLYATNKETEK